VSRHNSDIVSLVAGLIFLGVAGTWALERADLLPGSRGWLLPVILVAAGIAGLLSARPRRGTEGGPDDRRDPDQQGEQA
jgi:hypothetical protein